ncbi:MAG: helix-turn-helix transcriptional regulator [Clostridiales bacterium]|nr:helix-turn-helix transcriptional regulator [Clostridiales bacterium]
MEFNKKLQELRKNKGITQEQLAEDIYVSRTAVSKWESGRGYPNIDSLKVLAKYFSISVDELLSGEQLLILAEEDNEKKMNNIRDIVFGLLDLSIILLLFIPFFAQRIDGKIDEVSLLSLTKIETYLLVAYYIITITASLFGVLMLALQKCNLLFWRKNKYLISIIINILSVVLFTISLQPYVAILTFVFLIIKVSILIKLK